MRFLLPLGVFAEDVHFDVEGGAGGDGRLVLGIQFQPHGRSLVLRQPLQIVFRGDFDESAHVPLSEPQDGARIG